MKEFFKEIGIRSDRPKQEVQLVLPGFAGRKRSRFEALKKSLESSSMCRKHMRRLKK